MAGARVLVLSQNKKNSGKHMFGADCVSGSVVEALSSFGFA